MPGVQVDLMLRTVQPEAARTFGGASVDVVDEQGLPLLGHGCSIRPADWRTILGTSGRARASRTGSFVRRYRMKRQQVLALRIHAAV
jgi:hypothetical protein